MAYKSLTSPISILTLATASVSAGQNAAAQPARARAEIAFVSERYCFEGPVRFLELSVQMRLVNAHSANLYVLKREGHVRPQISRVYVAKNETDLELGMNELSIVVDSFHAEASASRRYNLDDFEELHADGVYEYRENFIISLTRSGAESSGQGIGAGPHVAAVVLTPWIGPMDRARQAEGDLRLDGTIWTEDTRTDAISFTVARTPVEEDCYKAFREGRGLK